MINQYKLLIKSALRKEAIEIKIQNNNLYIKIKPSSILRCMSILFSDEALQFKTLTDCFAVDFKEKGLSIYYQMLSYKLNFQIFVITNIKKNEIVQSMTILFKNANWLEREIFDMFGIRFNDHPDMRRILNNHDYNKFPLLK